MADAMKLLLEEARDLLLERRQGSLARSAAHNARLVIEDAIKLAASPPAREEAPDEEAGVSLDALADWLSERMAQSDDAARQHNQKAPAKHFCSGKSSAFGEVASVLWNSPEWFAQALRNRTSEPEAGAVAWRVRTSCGEGGFLTDSYPHNGQQLVKNGYSVQPLYLHPAPATADKLRDAVRAFMPVNIDLSNANLRDDQILPCDVTVGELRAIAAALNEQPQ